MGTRLVLNEILLVQGRAERRRAHVPDGVLWPLQKVNVNSERMDWPGHLFTICFLYFLCGRNRQGLFLESFLTRTFVSDRGHSEKIVKVSFHGHCQRKGLGWVLKEKYANTNYCWGEVLKESERGEGFHFRDVANGTARVRTN